MPLFRFIAAQLSNPTGWFGRHVMSRMLNRGNEELIGATLRVLDVQPTDRVLDVGFGGGLALERAARLATEGRLTGIDPSPDAVAAGRKRFRALLEAGRVELRCEAIEDLDDRGAFDKIITTNTVYFWPELEAPFAALTKAMAPGATLCVGFSGRSKMLEFDQITRHGFHLHRDEAIAEAARVAGLEAELLPQQGRRITGDFVLRADKPK